MMFKDTCIIAQFLQWKIQQDATVHQNFLLLLILNEGQHVSGDTTWQCPTTARPITFHICKTRGCLCSFRLLMMGGVSPEICWLSFKLRSNKKCWYTVAFCWIFYCKSFPSYSYWRILRIKHIYPTSALWRCQMFQKPQGQRGGFIWKPTNKWHY
jgi:hypothetical protein